MSPWMLCMATTRATRPVDQVNLELTRDRGAIGGRRGRSSGRRVRGGGCCQGRWQIREAKPVQQLESVAARDVDCRFLDPHGGAKALEDALGDVRLGRRLREAVRELDPLGLVVVLSDVEVLLNEALGSPAELLGEEQEGQDRPAEDREERPREEVDRDLQLAEDLRGDRQGDQIPADEGQGEGAVNHVPGDVEVDLEEPVTDEREGDQGSAHEERHAGQPGEQGVHHGVEQGVARAHDLPAEEHEAADDQRGDAPAVGRCRPPVEVFEMDEQQPDGHEMASEIQRAPGVESEQRDGYPGQLDRPHDPAQCQADPAPGHEQHERGQHEAPPGLLRPVLRLRDGQAEGKPGGCEGGCRSEREEGKRPLPVGASAPSGQEDETLVGGDQAKPERQAAIGGRAPVPGEHADRQADAQGYGHDIDGEESEHQ